MLLPTGRGEKMGAKLFENQQINESYIPEASITLTESTVDTKTGKKLRTIEGIAAKADIVNRNGRLYPRKVFEIAVERAKEKVLANKYLGELEHPWEVQTSLARAAVRFTDLWMEGDYVKFKGVILPTPNGQILESLLEAGVAVGVSTRGYGSYKLEEIDGREVEVIQDDYRMTGIDFVLDESNPYGAVHKFESVKGGGKQMEIKTVEELKAQFPELTKQLEDAAKAEGAKEREEQLKKEHEEAIEKAKQEAVEEYKKSEEAKKYENAFNAVVESLKPFLPETVQLTESELGQKVKTLESTLEAKNKEVDDLSKKLQEAQSKLDEIEMKEKVAKLVESKVKGHKFESILRPRLLECKTEEEVNKRFESEVAFLESLGIESTPAGQGIVNRAPEQQNNGGNGGQQQQQVTEQDLRLRRLAGLN